MSERTQKEFSIEIDSSEFERQIMSLPRHRLVSAVEEIVRLRSLLKIFPVKFEPSANPGEAPDTLVLGFKLSDAFMSPPA